MSVSVKMSSKNQIVVPKEAREALGLRPGDRLVVTVRREGVIEMERQPPAMGDKLEGLLAGMGEEGEAGLWVELGDE